jgi:solute carrier family 8 (sodium/calcium exchanger)
MGVWYLLFLGYLFLGIAISADIFMEAIEVITSQTTIKYIKVHDKYTNKTKEIPQEETVWNATLANLTLMAFGSSAPEIILSTLEAVKELGEPAGDLGPSTIVGSAAFNLLVISGVSIAAVDGVKKIDDLGVFFTTATFSIFAYVWLFLCLQVYTEGEVTITEASWTFAFFFILIIIAVSADKYRQVVKKKESSQRETEKNGCKTFLRAMAKEHGEVAVLAAA